MAVKSTKKFDGKVYKLFDFAFTKKEAEQEAKVIRRGGSSVRVVKSGEGYQLWRRDR